MRQFHTHKGSPIHFSEPTTFSMWISTLLYIVLFLVLFIALYVVFFEGHSTVVAANPMMPWVG
ncbi:MAG: hypothetical protein ACC707_11645 [Thiohalomonadales bacterium]